MAGRALALGLLLVAGVLVWACVIHPWQAWNHELGARIEAAERELAELRGMAAIRPELERRVAALPEPAIGDDYLTGESETIMLADLQDRLRAAAQSHGGRTRSTSVLAAVEEAGGVEKIGVQVQLQIGAAGLSELLYDLEAGRPLLFVENLELLARPTRDPADEPDLDASFDVVGYMREATLP